MKKSETLVAVLMGSASDSKTLEPCLRTLGELGIPHEVRVLSAHRTPAETAEYVQAAEGRGIKVIIAAAGMAAHLAGACAAHTTLPVIGIPISSGPMQGRDSLLSTVMMPPGMPVATVGIDATANAACLAAQILSLSEPGLKKKLLAARSAMREKVLAQDMEIRGKAD